MTYIINQRRLLRSVGYSMLVVAGSCGYFLYQGALTALLGAMTFAWATFLVIGGAAAVWAVVTDKWLGELAGIPLLVAALTVYGLALFIVAPTPVGIAIGALMLSLTSFLLARFRDLRVLSKAVRPQSVS